MNNLGNKIISPNIMEEKEIVEQLKNFLNEYISEEEVYSQIYEKSDKNKIEQSIEIMNLRDGRVRLTKKIFLQKIEEISTLRDLRKFIIRFQNILIKNISEKNPDFEFNALKNFGYHQNVISKQTRNEYFIEDLMRLAFGEEQKSKLENKYSQEVKETYNKIGDKIRDKLNQEDNIEYLEIKLKKYNIILGETIDIKNYKKIIEIAKQDERILELFKINPKFTIKILEKLENKEISLDIIEKFSYTKIISILNTDELQNNFLDSYKILGLDFLVASYFNLVEEKFKKFLNNKDLQNFIKENNLHKGIEQGDSSLIGNQIDVWQFLNNILNIENVSKYIFLTKLYYKEHLSNSLNYLLNYPKIINNYLNLDDLWHIPTILSLDPTNDKVKYFLDKNDDIIFDILRNHYSTFKKFLDGKYRKYFGFGKDISPEEFYEKYIKENNQKRTRNFIGADTWYDKHS